MFEEIASLIAPIPLDGIFAATAAYFFAKNEYSPLAIGVSVLVTHQIFHPPTVRAQIRTTQPRGNYYSSSF